ncbi:U32 family peptidase [Bacteriovoracaceae bacterium]|nr:U32 family peptidase [Bacteriovoracaceae bacterium]
MSIWVPELLSPAGSLEKLKVAMWYGADACYLGGQKFGLRSAADNFNEEELKEALEFAHSRNKLVYVVLNSFLHDEELKELPEFLKLLEEVKVDAVICSDLGVVQTVRKHSDLVVHLSTQASCLNADAARFWKDQGVKRIVLGREVAIADAKKIKDKVDIELEMFVHGSMCMAYSGNCVISNYTQGRDSNRGGCAHSCRFEYSLAEKESEEYKKAYFMSSKDLEGIRVLQDFIDAGIDSLKVEGRMKTHHYVGTISKVYSEALSHYKNNGNFLSSQLEEWERELRKVGHRDYTNASLIEKAGPDSVFNEREHMENEYVVGGVILEKGDDYTLVEVRSPFTPNDEIEIIPFHGKNVTLQNNQLMDVAGEVLEKTRPGMILKLPYIEQAQSFNLIRVRTRP